MRRNINGSCSGDPCCKPRDIRTINTMNPDDSGNFTVNAGDGIEVQTTTNGIQVSVKAPLPGPMIYQGTVGTGGTIASLPAANVTNIGWTYVAITAGTTPDATPKSYEIGDMLVSNGEEWTVIPAGDDPVDWSQIQNKPTTVSGYGITDAIKTSGDQSISGKLSASDPASGATDGTLTTANWISQTGDSSPNNLVHRSGNETILGVKNFDLSQTYLWGLNVGGNGILLASADMRTYSTRKYGTDTGNMANIYMYDGNDTILGHIRCRLYNDNVRLRVASSDGTNNAIAELITYSNGDVCMIAPFRVSSLAQVSGNTTYDNDVVTIKTLKNLGLIV